MNESELSAAWLAHWDAELAFRLATEPEAQRAAAADYWRTLQDVSRLSAHPEPPQSPLRAP